MIVLADVAFSVGRIFGYLLPIVLIATAVWFLFFRSRRSTKPPTP